MSDFIFGNALLIGIFGLAFFVMSVMKLISTCYVKAAPIGNVDKIQIVDFGGKGKGMNTMTKFVPSVAKQLIEGLEAVGMNPSELLSKIGISKQ